jgi:hypothetical protein
MIEFQYKSYIRRKKLKFSWQKRNYLAERIWLLKNQGAVHGALANDIFKKQDPDSARSENLSQHLRV